MNALGLPMETVYYVMIVIRLLYEKKIPFFVTVPALS